MPTRIFILMFLLLCITCSIKQKGNKDKLLIANQMLENGLYAEAIDNYLEILENNPDSNLEIFSMNMLILSYLKLGKYKEVINQAERMVKKYPDRPDGYNALGQGYHGIGEIDLALEKYWIAAQLDTNAMTPFIAGILAEDYNNLEMANKFYKECINKDPNFYNAYHNLSVNLLKLRKYEEARIYCAIILAKNVDDKRLNELYIEILKQQKAVKKLN